MTRPAVAPLVLLLLAACGDHGGHADGGVPPGWRPVAELPADLAAGRAVFETNCLQCHGEYALGTEQGPPLLHRYYEPGHHSDVAFQRAVAFGVQPHHWDFGPMPPVAGLSPDDVLAVTGYVRWLQRQAGIY